MMRIARIAVPAVAALALAACTAGAGDEGVTCPGCGLTTVSDTYTGSFIQGSASGPIAFTAAGQTAIVTFNAVKIGSPVPPAPVTGTFAQPCSAATVRSGPSDGQLTVTSVASGTCTLIATSNFGSAPVAVTVP
jgi:hypothetical protein